MTRKRANARRCAAITDEVAKACFRGLPYAYRSEIEEWIKAQWLPLILRVATTEVLRIGVARLLLDILDRDAKPAQRARIKALREGLAPGTNLSRAKMAAVASVLNLPAPALGFGLKTLGSLIAGGSESYYAQFSEMTPKEFPMPPTAEEMAAHRLQGALLFAPQTRGQIDSQFARKPLSFNELPSHVADISVDASDSAESVDIYLPSAAFSVPIPWRWSLAVRSLRLEHSQNQLDHMAWAIAVKMCQALNPGFPADVERGTTSTALFAIEGQGIEAKLPAGAWLERCASLMATHGIEVVRPFLEAGVVTALECILDYSTTDLVFGSGHPSSKQKAFMSRISKSVDCVPTVADRLNIRDASEYISRHLEQFNEAETARWSGAPVLPEV